MPMSELRTRVHSMVAYLDTVTEADVSGSDQREISLPYFSGKVLSEADYLNGYLLPNFYFHVTSAYQILRHNGVPLSKQDYLVNLNLRDPKL